MLAADVSRALARSLMALAAYADWAPAVIYGLATFVAVASKTFRPGSIVWKLNKRTLKPWSRK